MAKGQKRTSREPRKPKQDKPKPLAVPRSPFEALDQRASSHAKGSRR